MREKLLFTWSGGKDSAFALYEITKGKKYKTVALLTTVTGDYDRISMHGVRRAILQRQAKSLGIPLEEISIPKSTTNKEYESKMRRVLGKYLELGVRAVAFGDIFLEDVRKQRERNLAKVGMRGIFPLWKKSTLKLSHEFIALGFKAIITCVDSSFLDKSFCGRTYDEPFLADLPPGVDPCGENGEFHSFVYDGPIFRERVPVEIGDIIFRDKRYWFCDLLPKNYTQLRDVASRK